MKLFHYRRIYHKHLWKYRSKSLKIYGRFYQLDPVVATELQLVVENLSSSYILVLETITASPLAFEGRYVKHGVEAAGFDPEDYSRRNAKIEKRGKR